MSEASKPEKVRVQLMGGLFGLGLWIGFWLMAIAAELERIARALEHLK